MNFLYKTDVYCINKALAMQYGEINYCYFLSQLAEFLAQY